MKRNLILIAPTFLLTALTLTIALEFYVIDLNTWSTNFHFQLKKYKDSNIAVIPIQPTPSLTIADKYSKYPK